MSRFVFQGQNRLKFTNIIITRQHYVAANFNQMLAFLPVLVLFLSLF